MPLKRSESRSIYETFTYQNTTTSPQQSHPFTLSEDCNCDVLIVGGGGAGDRQAGGGGGGGTVLYAMSLTIPALFQYSIYIYIYSSSTASTFYTSS